MVKGLNLILGSMHSLIFKLNELLEFKVFQPSKKDQQTPDSLPFKEGQILDYVEQEHNAKRSGKHTDIRIGNKRGMFSWATKKALPEPGQKIQLHPQPIHPKSYNDFEGEIKSGYGAGTVRTRHKGKALVTRSGEGQTNITVTSKRGSHRLAILNTKLGHLLVREKHPEAPAAQKPAYKSLPAEEAPHHLRNLTKGSIVQPKIDGALVHIQSHKGKLEIFSHRNSKEGSPILHTERFFKERPKSNLPGKTPTISGELYGTRNGRAIEPQELGGILNSHIHKSIEKQKQQNVKLKIMPFDIQDRGTYPERLERLRAAVSQLPRGKFTLPESTNNPTEALKLFKRIKEGKHPLTREGLIIRPPNGKLIKIKNVQEENVKIAATFSGSGKYEKSHGGFIYHDNHGNPIGNVGTGFTDETRRNLHRYIGRTARIRHQGKYPSGAFRAPVFIGIDESR